jgi:hypothetical protein
MDVPRFSKTDEVRSLLAARSNLFKGEYFMSKFSKHLKKLRQYMKNGGALTARQRRRLEKAARAKARREEMLAHQVPEYKRSPQGGSGTLGMHKHIVARR